MVRQRSPVIRPIFIQYRHPHRTARDLWDRFERGPFYLGSFSYPIATAAVLWIALISIVFCLPQLNPINAQALNHAPVAVGIVIAYTLGFWFLSARTWFTGPVKQMAGMRPLPTHSSLREC